MSSVNESLFFTIQLIKLKKFQGNVIHVIHIVNVEQFRTHINVKLASRNMIDDQEPMHVNIHGGVNYATLSTPISTIT